jgi:hypothetical protein
VIRVRRYTIRYTSYGPPTEHLQLILHAVDWLGYHRKGPRQPNSLEPKPRWSDSEELLAITQQLDDTRAREDYRCFGLEVTAGEADNTSIVMCGSDDASQAASQSHTQMAFDTQLPHAPRVRPSEDAPKIIGVRSLEPVLAGNTQREDIRPVSRKATTTGFNDSAKLLSLLGRTVNSNANYPSKPRASPSQSRKTVSTPQQPSSPAATQMLTQLPTHVQRQPTQSQTATNDIRLKSPKQTKGKQQASESKAVSPGVEDSTEQDTGQAHAAQASQSCGNYLQKLASECSWMQDFEFTREAFKVPPEQLNILRNQDSWHKPLPGHKFPDGNIPVNILTRLERSVDQEAAKESAPDSDDEMEDDPSPEFPVGSIATSTESAPQPTQDTQDPSSPIPWSPSPTPVPPRMLAQSNQQLPPDSSEPTGATADDKDGKASIVTQTRHPVFIDLSNEDERNDPPSSPPVEDMPMALDEDVGMEEYVPRGLGEDSLEAEDQQSPHHVPSASPSPRSIVQVKETPYVKGKNGEHEARTVSPPIRRPSSSGMSKETSSTSIIYGTYNDKAPSGLDLVVPHSDSNFRARPKGANESVQQLKDRQQTPPHKLSAQLSTDAVLDDSTHDMFMAEADVSPLRDHVEPENTESDNIEPDNISLQVVTGQDSNPTSLPEAISISAQMPPNISWPAAPAASLLEGLFNNREHSAKDIMSTSPSTMPGTGKRKHDNSPTKKSGRHSKRREIKIPAFGDDTPDLTDPVSAMRHYRDEEYKKFREARNSSASVDSRPDSAGRAETQQHGDAMQIDRPSVLGNDAQTPALSSRLESLYDEPNHNKPVPAVAAVVSSGPVSVASPTVYESVPEASSLHTFTTGQGQSTTTSSTEAPRTVFESFKAAYPEYTGDIKHFQGQCTQMIKLDREDKMVPKWQWDDFIIRNRTDYKDYALQCVDQGENPEPYHRFYKDTIRDTVYRKGIIEGRSTLLEALRQLKVQAPGSEPRATPTKPMRKEKRSRGSLPSAFNQPKPPNEHGSSITPHNRPRHSLPSRPPHNDRTPVDHTSTNKPRGTATTASRDVSSSARSTPKPNPTRLALDGAATPCTTPVNGHTTAGASDPFRDAIKAWKRTTSLTGSTKVSSESSREPRRKS